MNNESLPIATRERNLIVFWREAMPNGMASQKSARSIFDDVLFLRIIVPGDTSSPEYEVERTYPEEFPHPIYGKVKKNDIVFKRFDKEIADYKARQEGPGVVSGTPLEQWPMVNTRQCAMLKAQAVYNVESLAMLSDAAMANIGMGMRDLVQKAKDWLASAEKNAHAMEAQRRERETNDRFEALEAKFREVTEVLTELPADMQDAIKKGLAKRAKRAA